MVKYRSYFFILIMIFPLLVNAQDYSDYRFIDSVSYQQYSQKDWKNLINTGRQGIRNGLDYYYLRMRKGIAEYETGKYIAATSDFERALDFYNNDKTAKSYKYYALIHSGKKARANRYSMVFTKTQKKELGIQIKPLGDLNLYGGYTLSNNFKENENTNLLDSDSINYSQQLLIGNQLYLHAGLSINAGSVLSFYASFSYLNLEKHERFQYRTVNFYIRSTNHQGNGSYINIFSQQTQIHDQVFSDAIQQKEAYLNAKFQLNDGWSANLFGNLLFIRTKQYLITPVISVKRDTLSYNKPNNNYMFITHQNVNYDLSANDTTFTDWVAGFNLQKDFNFIVLNLGASTSKIYADRQYQTNLSATYYPFGSFRLYGTTGFTYLHEPDAPVDEDISRYLINQTIGVQLSKHAWLEGEYIYGDLKNVNIKQGLVVFNLPDKINYTIGVKLYIFAGKHLMINLQSHLYDKSGLYFNFSGSDNSINTYSTHYQAISIIGGIKWII